MSDIAKITKLLHDDSLERQMAAVIVLGELCAGGPDVISGLLHALSSEVPLLQRHAVSALTRIGPTELALCAKDTLLATSVRLEALTALRLVVGTRNGSSAIPADDDVALALIDIAGDDDRALAQSALSTLSSLSLGPEAAQRLAKLVAHPELDRARFVIDQLGRRKDEHATSTLVGVITSLDRRRAEFAAGALTGNEAAITPLAEALLETKDADRVWLIRNVLRPNANKVPAALRKKLLDAAMDRFAQGAGGGGAWEALLDIVRDADPNAVASALRLLARRLQKESQVGEAIGVWQRLCASDRATDEDRGELAQLESKTAAPVRKRRKAAR